MGVLMTIEGTDVEGLVIEAYERRLGDWRAAAQQVDSWLRGQSNQLLNGQDPSRICVAGHRIKDRKRALDKLRRKISEEAASVRTVADVEVALRDLVGTKVLCKSPRDQRLIFDALNDPQRLDTLRCRFQVDYTTEVKPSGYRACHSILEVPVPAADPVLVEVQVKTRLQDAWSELTHEDLYKPGSAIRPGRFHGSVARTMAALLAEVDHLADELAAEIASSVEPPATPGTRDSNGSGDDHTIEVRVRTTGPRYALAVDDAGQQGIITALAVREALDLKGFISVSDFIHVDDVIEVNAQTCDRGIYYLPRHIPSDGAEEQHQPKHPVD